MIREIASWLTMRPCTGTDPFTGPTLSPRASACKRPAIWRGVCERPRSASTLDRSTGSAATLPGWGRARRRCARQSAVTILYPRVVVVLRRTSRETTDAHRSMCAAIARIDQPALSPVAISTRSATVNILRTHNPPPDQHRCHDAMTPPTWSGLSLIHISEPTRLGMISYAVFCLKKKKKKKQRHYHNITNIKKPTKTQINPTNQ